MTCVNGLTLAGQGEALAQCRGDGGRSPRRWAGVGTAPGLNHCCLFGAGNWAMALQEPRYLAKSNCCICTLKYQANTAVWFSNAYTNPRCFNAVTALLESVRR